MENKTNNENIHTYDNGFHPKEVTLKDDYIFYPKNAFYRFINLLTVRFTQFFLFFHKKLVLGYKVTGRKNKKNIKGSIIVCNHVHPLDALLQLTSINKRGTYITTLQSNLGFGLVSKYFRNGGCVPIPVDPTLTKKFMKETKQALQEGKNIIFYPEAALQPYCDHIRPFMSGAFQFAVNANANIIPCVITYHKPRGLYKLIRGKKPCIHYNILEQYVITPTDNKKETIEKTKNDVFNIMNDYFNTHSEIKGV